MTSNINKIELNQLPQVSDRVTFLYVEHCRINRQDGAITISDSKGIVFVPAAVIGIILLGPGSDITHRAVELLADIGTNISWVGEHGVRQYAHGRPLAHNSKYIEIQAKYFSNSHLRVGIARKMYQMRFPNEDVSKLTMQQLRGREGARIRSIYRKYSKQFNVEWNGREYNPDDFQNSTPVNQALSSANVCLYGLVHSVVSSLGFSTALGFVHTGHDLSFVYDVADLYKAEYTIPLAFEIASNADDGDDIGKITRLAIRDRFSDGKLIKTIVKDLQKLFDIQNGEQIEIEHIELWDDKEGSAKYGINYREL